jgi:hypothetical protein
MEGWIKLHRCLVENSLWNSEPFSKGQAWVDLLLIANHKESFFYKRGNKITVKRGQVGRSEVELSDRWKWSRNKVNKFLKDLEKEQQILIIKSTITQVLTIVNYDTYQEKEQQTIQQTIQQKDSRKTAEGTTEEQQKDTYNNDKNVNNDKNEKKKDIPVSEISILKPHRIWHQEIETYPMYTTLHPELKEAVKFYLDDQEEKEKRGITTSMVKTTLIKVQGHLGKFDYKKVATSLYNAVQKSNKDFNPAWNEANQTDTNNQDPKIAHGYVMGKQKVFTGKC